jgi:hypothetical protein
MSVLPVTIVLLTTDVNSVCCYDDLKVTVVMGHLMPATIVKRSLVATVPSCSSGGLATHDDYWI